LKNRYDSGDHVESRHGLAKKRRPAFEEEET